MEEKLLTFGDRLRIARERKGLSQVSVAAFVGVEEGQHARVGHWENGRNFPELASLVTVAELYAVSIDYLIWGDDVANGLGARVRNIPKILRDGLVMKLHEEITKAEEAAKLLPPEMKAEALRDRDARVQKFADANLRPKAKKPIRKARTK